MQYICRVGQNHTFIGMYGVYTVFLAGNSPYIRSFTVCIYGSGQPDTYAPDARFPVLLSGAGDRSSLQPSQSPSTSFFSFTVEKFTVSKKLSSVYLCWD